MRARVLSIGIAGVLAGLLILTVAFAALGAEQDARLFLTVPNVVRCDRGATLTARVVNARTGAGVSNRVVHWSMPGKRSSGDRLSARSSVTNSEGFAVIRISFGPKAGLRMVKAGASGSRVQKPVRCAGGLPKTSTLPARGLVELSSSAPLAPPAATSVGVLSSEPLPVASIRLDRLGIDLPITEGDGYHVPKGAAAHYPDTAWPGEGSNTYVYAHAREGHFKELWQVRTGDLVEMDMADGNVAAYRVSQIHPLVAWDALEFLHPTAGEIVTLQTCLTYDETAPRFVVIAERISSA